MVDRLAREDGTTLTELLVVIALLGIVGTVTTVGIVTGFRAQADSTNVSATLDGMRIATQRVREFVRGADEVCAASEQNRLVLWTDEDGEGDYDETEVDIFEIVTDAAGESIFQRRTPTGSGSEVTQLIRDDIINGTVFIYNGGLTDPTDQPSDLECMYDSVPPGTGSAAVRVVDVQFQVEHPDPAEPDLETSTSVRLRNAELAEPSQNDRPSAKVDIRCTTTDKTCEFDATETSDPEDGGPGVLFYSWEIYDGATLIDTITGYGTAGTDGVDSPDHFSYTFAVADKDYDVVLTVTDSDGATDTTSAVASPVLNGNPAPTADFTITNCATLTCSFDASASADDTGIATYEWDFGSDGTGTGVAPSHTFSKEGTYTVTLTVTDDLGATDTDSQVVTVGSKVIYVSAMSGTQSGSGGNRTASVSVQMTLGTAGDPGEGIVITVEATTDKKASVLEKSCTTNSSGNCMVSFTGLSNSEFPVTAKVLSVSTGSYTYDPGQDKVTEVTVS